jgi:hypothetical protein
MYTRFVFDKNRNFTNRISALFLLYQTVSVPEQLMQSDCLLNNLLFNLHILRSLIRIDTLSIIRFSYF